MSLINQVLQDLETRRAGQSDDLRLPEQVRSVAAPTHGNRRRFRVWLFASLGVLIVVLFGWYGSTQIRDRLNGLPERAPESPPVATSAAKPVHEPEAPVPVRAQVDTALIVPVLQMSDALTTATPDFSRKLAESETPTVAASVKPALKRAARRELVASESKGVGSDPASTANRQTEPVAVQKKQPKQTRPEVTEQDVAGTAAVQPKSADRPADEESIREEPIETVEIPADLTRHAIEKQAHQLTAFERAENEFRLGVASLRRGRMPEAEAHFRLAIKEDRSHGPAQQALVGMLIDAGRLEDAESVLDESLGVNPRQPKQAMILARLQVERGDLNLAIRTLEGTIAYAGSDSSYLSFMAAVLQRAERHQQAAVQYRKALALMPRNAVWLMGLGISLRALGETEQAQQAFGSAASIGTLNPDLQAFVEQQYGELKRSVN